jgi:hypothetical protein
MSTPAPTAGKSTATILYSLAEVTPREYGLEGIHFVGHNRLTGFYYVHGPTDAVKAHLRRAMQVGAVAVHHLQKER